MIFCKFFCYFQKVKHRYQRFFFFSLVIDRRLISDKQSIRWQKLIDLDALFFPCCESILGRVKIYARARNTNQRWLGIELIKVAVESYNGSIDAFKYRLQRQQFMLFLLDTSRSHACRPWHVTRKCHFFVWCFFFFFWEVDGRDFSHCFKYLTREIKIWNQ